MRVAVIGLGAVGASALYFLSKWGYEAVGYEQFALGHTRGSSHGESRIFRLTYPDPTYTRMMREALPLWQALQAEAGEELIVPCGVLWLGAEDDPELRTVARSLQSEGVPFAWLTPTESHARFPALRLQPHERALFQHEGGFLRASACVSACLRLAQQYGAQIYPQTPLVRFESRPEGVRLEFANGATETFDRVVLTVGAWLTKHLPHLNLPLTVTRQTYAYFAIKAHTERFEPDHMPVWIEATRHFYGFPNDGRQPGVKVALHQLGEPHDPDQPARPVEEADLAPLRAMIAQRLPDLNPDEVLSAHTCLYTNTPDARFLLQPLLDDRRIWYVSACSGHGFKFAILNGKRVAESGTS